MKCQNCKFHDAAQFKKLATDVRGSQAGFCRARPPVIAAPAIGKYGCETVHSLSWSLTTWPVTPPDAWCAEFSPLAKQGVRPA